MSPDVQVRRQRVLLLCAGWTPHGDVLAAGPDLGLRKVPLLAVAAVTPGGDQGTN